MSDATVTPIRPQQPPRRPRKARAPEPEPSTLRLVQALHGVTVGHERIEERSTCSCAGGDDDLGLDLATAAAILATLLYERQDGPS